MHWRVDVRVADGSGPLLRREEAVDNEQDNKRTDVSNVGG